MKRAEFIKFAGMPGRCWVCAPGREPRWVTVSGNARQRRQALRAIARLMVSQ